MSITRYIRMFGKVNAIKSNRNGEVIASKIKYRNGVYQ